MIDKNCRNCGKDAGAKRTTKEFCSTACHDDWWMRNRRMWQEMASLFPCLCQECKAKLTNYVTDDGKRLQIVSNPPMQGPPVEGATSGT